MTVTHQVRVHRSEENLAREDQLAYAIAEVAAERMPGTLAVTLAGVAQGIQIHRVHDVADIRQGLALWRAVTEGDR